MLRKLIAFTAAASMAASPCLAAGFAEPTTTVRLLLILVIVGAIAGLRLTA